MKKLLSDSEKTIRKWNKFHHAPFIGISEKNKLELANHMQEMMNLLNKNEDIGEFSINCFAIRNLFEFGYENINLNDIIKISSPLYWEWKKNGEQNVIDAPVKIAKKIAEEYKKQKI